MQVWELRCDEWEDHLKSFKDWESKLSWRKVVGVLEGAKSRIKFS